MASPETVRLPFRRSVSTRRRLWRYVYDVDVTGNVQVVQFRFENDGTLLPVAVLGRPGWRRGRYGVVMPGGGGRRPSSAGAEVVHVLNDVFRWRPTGVRPLRQRGDARPEVIDPGVEAAQLTARAQTQTGDKADNEREDHAENDNSCHRTSRVQTCVTAWQRLVVTRTYVRTTPQQYQSFSANNTFCSGTFVRSSLSCSSCGFSLSDLFRFPNSKKPLTTCPNPT